MTNNLYDTLTEPQKEIIESLVDSWVTKILDLSTDPKNKDEVTRSQLTAAFREGATKKMKMEGWL